MKNKKAYLLSTRCGGNAHAATDFINTLDLAAYVLAMDCGGAHNTNIVLRVNTWDEYVLVCGTLREEMKLTREYFE